VKSILKPFKILTNIKKYSKSIDFIRNIAIIAHVDAGKKILIFKGKLH
jgi:hypothetical protein